MLTKFDELYPELYTSINEHEYVSFDVFDTLVSRTLSAPEQLFGVVQYIGEERGHTIPGGFKKKRIEAEMKARRIKKTEVTFADIYDQSIFVPQILE